MGWKNGLHLIAKAKMVLFLGTSSPEAKGKRRGELPRRRAKGGVRDLLENGEIKKMFFRETG